MQINSLPSFLICIKIVKPTTPHIAKKTGTYIGITANVYKQAGATLFPNNINFALVWNIKIKAKRVFGYKIFADNNSQGFLPSWISNVCLREGTEAAVLQNEIFAFIKRLMLTVLIGEYCFLPLGCSSGASYFIFIRPEFTECSENI